MKIFVTTMLTVFLALGMSVTAFCASTDQPKPAAATPPQDVRVKLPNGQEVTAHRINRTTGKAEDVIKELVLKGTLKMLYDKKLKVDHLVLQTDTKEVFFLIGEPYVNTLKEKALGKTAKLKGKTLGASSFDNHVAFLVSDILEVK